MGMNSGAYSNGANGILNGSDLAYLYATGNDFVIGNSTASQNLIFFNGGTALTNESFRITSSGSVGIGTTSPADKLNVAGILSPAADNSYTTGTSTSRWSAVYAANGTIQTSDARLKSNIRPMNYGWSQLAGLRPVQYQWKDQPAAATKGEPADPAGTRPASSARIGLIAQQVRTVVPEVVIGDESREHLGMNYAELIPVLIQTLKEQQRQLAQLKEKLEEIKASK